MDVTSRKQLLAKYKEGPRVVADALAGATDAELNARPAPGKWCAREIVHHLGDSEMTAAIRLRLLLAEDHPTIRAYDQDAFARKLYYDRPIEASLSAFRWAREASAQILERLTEEEWRRTGHHTEAGHYSVDRWLETYAKHAHDHADQIRRARAGAGAASA